LIGGINAKDVRETANYTAINDLGIYQNFEIIPVVSLGVVQEFESNLALP